MLGLIFIFLVIGIIFMIKGARKFDKSIKQSKDTEAEFNNELDKNNIIATQKLFLNLNKKLYQMLVIDDVNKKLVYLTKTKNKKQPNLEPINIQSFKYSDVLKCELISVSNYETKEANTLFSERKETRNIYYKQGFRIILNDLSNPFIEIIYDDSIIATSVSYMQDIEEWMSKIDIVINKGKELKVN